MRDGREEVVEIEIEDEKIDPQAAVRGFWERLSDNLGDHASLAEALMLRGAMNIVGTYWPVGDTAAMQFSLNFYASLLAGDRLGLAMSKGRHAVFEMKSGDWANYIHYGDPEYLLRRT